MRRVWTILLVTAVAVAAPAFATHLRASAAVKIVSPGVACELPGLRSWAVKTLGDPNARSVVMKPKPTTVAALTKLHRPAVYHIGTRLHGVGTTVWQVHADLVGAQIEHDHDIHLIIADPHTGVTMVAEFPDVACWGAKTSFARPLMQRARAAFLAACGPVGSEFPHFTGQATITGVGFYDRFHRHLVPGTAPNAIELHPALSFRADSCSRT